MLNEFIQERAVVSWSLAFFALACVLAFVLSYPRLVPGIALGAALALLNFHALFAFSRRVLFQGAGGGTWFALRFLLLGGALWLALALGADPVGLLIGLSLLIPAAVAAAFQVRPKPDPAAAPSQAPPCDEEEWERWNPWLARERIDAEEDEAR